MKKIRNRKMEKVNRFDENGQLRKTGAELREHEKAMERFRRPAYGVNYSLGGKVSARNGDSERVYDNQ